jgi:hypothetical protein
MVLAIDGSARVVRHPGLLFGVAAGAGEGRRLLAKRETGETGEIVRSAAVDNGVKMAQR